MVWRYTEYSGCPQLTDWDKKQFKFGIILDEDTIIGEPMNVEHAQDLIDVIQLPTNGILRPHFYMRVGENSSSVFNLEFDRNGGLVRRIWTFEPGTTIIKGFLGEYQKIIPQKIDAGKFEDFKRMGEFAIRRFPKIAEEIPASPQGFNEDVPDDEKKEVEVYFEKVDTMPSWEAVQRDLSNDFWSLFSVYIIFEVGKSGSTIRQNPFTPKQVQELQELVEPLKN